MLEEKELEQISEIVERTKERADPFDGCAAVVAVAILLLAIFGAYCLIIIIWG